MEILSTTRKKTLTFYNQNPNFDFEVINEMMIDIFEKIITNISGEITNTITKDIMSLMKDQTYQMIELKKEMEVIKNNIIMKLYDIKNENMENIKMLINKNDNENIKTLIEKIEKENLKLLEELIPKNNKLYYEQYEHFMKIFKDEIQKTNQSENIELKYNNLLKNLELSIISNINNSEMRIYNIITEKNNDINEIKTNNMYQQKINTEIVSKLNEIKKENLETIKLFIHNNDNNNIKTIVEKIERENLNLIEELIPNK